MGAASEQRNVRKRITRTTTCRNINVSLGNKYIMSDYIARLNEKSNNVVIYLINPQMLNRWNGLGLAHINTNLRRHV